MKGTLQQWYNTTMVSFLPPTGVVSENISAKIYPALF